MILTLLERLKPELAAKLEQSSKKYKVSVENIKEVLKSKCRYDELTMGEISSLHTWTDTELLKMSIWELKFGDNFFIETQYSEDV